MTVRPITEADLERVLDCAVEDAISWAHPERLRSFLASGHYRHPWIWVSEERGEIMARAVWWGLPDAHQPLALDCLAVHPSATDPVGLTADLLNHAHAAFGHRPAYHVFVSPGWRDDPEVAAAIAWRGAAAGRAGLTDELERLRYTWTADTEVPPSSGRLELRAHDDDEPFVEAFRRVAIGTLDHHTRDALRTMDPVAQARADVAAYRALPGDRSWWRLAYTRDGDLAGFALPSANAGGPVVGYLGVVPELRGQGYVDDLLAEITRSHASRGAVQVLADTDADNAPMARAFARAGYRNSAIRLVLSPSPTPA